MDTASSIKKYKNSVTRKYISLSNDEIDVITKGDYWLSKKYDGQLWFYCKSKKNSKIKYLVSHAITQKNLQLKQLKIMQVILLLDLFLNPNLSKMQ